MEFIKTGFNDLWVIKPRIFGDERGYFLESYNAAVFKTNGIHYDFVQDNQSKSRKGVLRGLHFQVPPYAQGKLVSVIQGSVLDVAVDLRKSEPTFGKHFAIKLTGREKTMVFVPPGFAHGFASLEDDTIFAYKCTANYNKEAEDAILWNDPELNIDWGIQDPVISEKDAQAKLFSSYNSPFE